MEEQLQPQPVQSRGVSAVHAIMVVLLIATLGGIGYLGWMMQTQSAMSETAATADDEAAELRAELAEKERMLAEEKAKTPTGDVVIYENVTEGFRVVTAPGCEGVFAVRPGQPMPELAATARWDIFALRSSHWATNPFRALLKIDAETLGSMKEDPANQNRPELHQLDDAASIRLPTDVRPGVSLRLYQFLQGDGPSTEEIKSTIGIGVCPYVLQTIPRVMPEGG